jgi:hypothetical protein
MTNLTNEHRMATEGAPKIYGFKYFFDYGRKHLPACRIALPTLNFST